MPDPAPQRPRRWSHAVSATLFRVLFVPFLIAFVAWPERHREIVGHFICESGTFVRVAAPLGTEQIRLSGPGIVEDGTRIDDIAIGVPEELPLDDLRHLETSRVNVKKRVTWTPRIVATLRSQHELQKLETWDWYYRDAGLHVLVDAFWP